MKSPDIATPSLPNAKFAMERLWTIEGRVSSWKRSLSYPAYTAIFLMILTVHWLSIYGFESLYLV